MSDLELEPGLVVNVAYTGYYLSAKILSYDGNGWWNVEQITDFEDDPEGERPQYIVAEEYISLPGEPIKPGPFTFWMRQPDYRARDRAKEACDGQAV